MSTGTAVVRYQPRGAARELFEARDEELVIAGPAGTGKSMAALFRLHATCLRQKKVRALLLRLTQRSLVATTLETPV